MAAAVKTLATEEMDTGESVMSRKVKLAGKRNWVLNSVVAKCRCMSRKLFLLSQTFSTLEFATEGDHDVAMETFI